MKRNIRMLLEIGLSFVIAFAGINYFFFEQKKFEDFDLGSETSTYFAKKDNYPIHISRLDSLEYYSLIEGWKKRGSKKVILILGNSQTHAINQYKTGDSSYPEILQSRFSDQGFDVITQSIPNANLQEFYLLYSFWSSVLPIEKVIIPVFIDDLREDGIRNTFISHLLHQSYSIKDSTLTASKINSTLLSYKSISEEPENSDMKALEETVQEKSELYLNNKLKDRFESWNYRANVRGSFFTFLYKLRNTIFNVSPQTKRSIIPNLKNKNLQALSDLCDKANLTGSKVFMYIPPLRKDVDPPYFKEEYNSAINEIHQVALQKGNNRFRNLDFIVEGKYWGTKDPTAFFRKREYDFMHFQAKGHTILADSLYSFLNQYK